MLQCDAVRCSALHSDSLKHSHWVSCSVLQCVAECCSALQCAAVRCSVLQCVRSDYLKHTRWVSCSVSQRVAECRSVSQCVAVRCSVFQCVSVCCSASRENSSMHTLQHTATHCSARPQQLYADIRWCQSFAATHCNTLQHTTTHCNLL